MYIGICLGDATFTCKQYITNTSLVINNSNLNYEHVDTGTIHSHLYLHTPDILTNICSSVQTHPAYNPSTPSGQ